MLTNYPYRGCLKSGTGNQAWIGRPKAAIQIKCGNNINFNHCTFQHLAATGVDYERAVSASIVENCHFTDIGGTALLVGTFPDEGFETHVPYTPFMNRNYVRESPYGTT